MSMLLSKGCVQIFLTKKVVSHISHIKRPVLILNMSPFCAFSKTQRGVSNETWRPCRHFFKMNRDDRSLQSLILLSEEFLCTSRLIGVFVVENRRRPRDLRIDTFVQMLLKETEPEVEEAYTWGKGLLEEKLGALKNLVGFVLHF